MHTQWFIRLFSLPTFMFEDCIIRSSNKMNCIGICNGVLSVSELGGRIGQGRVSTQRPTSALLHLEM